MTAPLMPIPRHVTCSRETLAEAVADCLQRHQDGRFWFFAAQQPVPQLSGDRLTRVPFLKLCMEGGFQVVDRERKTWIGPGDLVYFAAGSFANVLYETPCVLMRITFDENSWLIGKESVEQVDPLGLAKLQPAGLLEAVQLPDPKLFMISSLLNRLANLSPGHSGSPRAFDTARMLWWEICAWLQASKDPDKPVPLTPKVSVYLRDQCHRPLNRQQAARALGVSEGHLGRLLKAETGKSFSIFMRDIRLEQAEWLLRNRELSVEEVALRCGFTSANYFSQVFKKQHGCSPKRWIRFLQEV